MPGNDASPLRRTAVLHGHEMSYVEHPGFGAPLVLIHGVGASIRTWEDIPERLARSGRSVLAIDLLGHGESGYGNGDFSLGANANSIRDLLDHLGHQHVHLVGHSLGGGVALQFAYQYPAKVESLTLVASGGLGLDAGSGLRAASRPGSELVLRLLTSAPVLRTGTWVNRALDRVGVAGGVLSPETIDGLRVLRDDQRQAAFLATLRSVVGPQGQKVSGIEPFKALDPHRVLLVWGDSDAMIPWQHGLNANDLLPGSRFVLVPGAGHQPHTHDPELFTDVVLAHLAQQVRASA